MTSEQLREAADLWRMGMSAPAIAATLGIPETILWNKIRHNRHLFPYKGSGCHAKPTRWIERDRTIVWITETGARVTLPKVSILARAA